MATEQLGASHPAPSERAISSTRVLSTASRPTCAKRQDRPDTLAPVPATGNRRHPPSHPETDDAVTALDVRVSVLEGTVAGNLVELPVGTQP